MNNFELESWINNFLNAKQYSDYTVNGLQVEGRSQVKHLILAVTANQKAIDYAIKQNADGLLVHHGYFWKGSNPAIIGYHYQRIAKLIKNDLNLFAYHLPLDFNMEVGNCVEIAKRIGLTNLSLPGRNPGADACIVVGEFTTPQKATDLKRLLDEIMEQEVTHFHENCPEYITKVGICTGGGQGFFDQAINLGCDAYLTGEMTEYNIHSAVEQGKHFYRLGHHASEKFGVQALGKILTEKFGIKVEFFDYYNPA